MFQATRESEHYVALHHYKNGYGRYAGQRLVDPCPSVRIGVQDAREMLPALAHLAGLPNDCVALLAPGRGGALEKVLHVRLL